MFFLFYAIFIAFIKQILFLKTKICKHKCYDDDIILGIDHFFTRKITIEILQTRQPNI